MALVSSDRTLSQLSHKEDMVLGFRVHRMLHAEFLQAAQVTIYDYYEPCEQASLRVDGYHVRGRDLLRTGPGGRGGEGEIGRG